MAFTEDEVDAVIESYLSSTVNVTRTKTGNRDTTAIKRQVYDLLSTGIFIRPASIFYLLWLSSNRFRSVAANQLARIRLIEAAAPNVSRVSKRVESTVELVNAEAAILELTGTFNQRTSGVSGSVGPGLQRFRNSITAFATTELTKNVVLQGEVIETAEELRENVRELWVLGAAAEAELQTRTDALEDALDNYRAVRLPETVFQALVAKVQTRLNALQTLMSASTAPRDSRATLLELLAMRTLMQRASTFKAPVSVLAPLTSDPKTGSLVDGDGTQATLLGTVSGPFNYATGAALGILVNQGADTLSTVLPGTSAAVLRSKVMAPWVNAPNTNSAVFVVNNDVVNFTPMVVGGAWASGASTAAALDAAFASITVTWDAGESRLVFTTDQTNDTAALRVTGHADFISWAFDGEALTVDGVPVDISLILQAIHQDSSFVEAEEVRTSYLQREAAVSGTALTLHIHDGTDLDATGSAVVTTSADLGRLGVLPGHLIKITSPAVTRAILSVDGNTLTLDDVVSAVTGATYFIAPDLTEVTSGARVHLSSRTIPENTGFARVTASATGVLTLDQSFTADTVQVSVFTSFLQISAVGTAVDSDLVSPTTTGSTAVGMASASSVVELSKFSVPSIDFLSRSVAVGDLITLVSPTAVEYECSIEEVGVAYVIISPPVLYESGSWTYEIESVHYRAFETLCTALAAFEAALPTNMELVIRRLISGAQLSASLQSTLTQYVSALENLVAALDAYVVPREPTMDRAVALLREHGMDRALDLLLDLELTEFFTMKDDEVSYRTWLIRRSADVARELVPVTKDPRDTAAQWRTISSSQEAFDPRATTDKEPNG